MKRLLAGCLVILLFGLAAVGAMSYFLYRAASPLIEDARATFQGFSELESANRRVENRSAFAAPASGELTSGQVDRFVRVQKHVRTALGARVQELDDKYRHLTTGRDGSTPPSFAEAVGALRDLAGLVVDARRYQVEALNTEGFSQEEYSWVRARVFEAAGVEVSGRIDLSKLEEALRNGTGLEGLSTERLPRPKVPERNVELLKPHIEGLNEWLPVAFFGF